MFSGTYTIGTLLAAQAGKQAEPGAAAGFLLPLVICFAIFYFLVLMPGNRERKQRKKMMESLKRGDEVVTSSGVIGTISDMSETEIALEISRNVKVRFLRSAILKRTEEITEKADSKVAATESPKTSKS